LDADGDLDLMGFTAGDPERQVALYRNDLPAQHWLNVRPVGLAGNRSATNAQIRLYEAGTDHLLWFEEVLAFSKQAQQNYYAFDQLERHYGLGARESVDVTVTFYPTGTTVRKDGATADTTIAIGEDGTNGVVEPPKPTSPSGGANTAGADTGGAPTAVMAGNGGAPPSGGASGGTAGASGAAPPNAEPSSGDASCACRLAAPRGGGLAVLAGVLAVWRLARRQRSGIASRPRVHRMLRLGSGDNTHTCPRGRGGEPRASGISWPRVGAVVRFIRPR
jgi:hypothetical protein